MNVIVGGILQESNTFSIAQSNVENFKRYFFKTGHELNESLTLENEYKGFLQAAKAYGAVLHSSLYVQAVSAGPVTRSALNELKQLLRDQLDRALAEAPSCDGILFALHGAWVAEDEDDADGEIIALLREWAGADVPIVVTLDSHCNVTERIVALTDGLIGYRTFPHVDFVDTGRRAGELLFRMLRQEIKPHMRFVKVPMILQAENQQTYRGPMFELWEEARKGEAQGRSLFTSLFAVQPWLDVEQMGFSSVVIAETPEAAEAEAMRLAEMAWEKREDFVMPLYSVEEVVTLRKANPSKQPFIISDSADSPGAGSPGDSNFVLKCLLDLAVENELQCLLSMVDAAAARQAAAASIGQVITLRMGHSMSTNVGEPIVAEGVVTAIGDGVFAFGGGTVAGMEANMGACAVIAIGRISLLLMENPTFTGDPAMYRSVGLEPKDADLVLVKSANQFRAEYESISEHIYILNSPGASTANLLDLTYCKIERPMYPFDDHFDWKAQG